MCVLVQIEIEIVMAMTHRVYAQYVHIHGNKKIKQGDKISDNNETRMRRMVSVSLCACVNSPAFPAKAGASSLDEDRWRRWEGVRLCRQRAEIQVLLDDPANFYNIVMSNSG